MGALVLVNPLGWLGSRLFYRRLQETGPVLTFARLCTSRHLVDLQVIASVMIYIAVVTFVATVVAKFWVGRPISADAMVTIGGTVGAATLAVLSWAYQIGSRRIGSVDLFACEISAICRVSLVVNFAKVCVERAEAADAAVFRKFTSVEEYTPVYDNNLSDLQPLDVNVVTYVTEFYTYRKTMMDILRRIAVAERRRGSAPDDADDLHAVPDVRECSPCDHRADRIRAQSGRESGEYPEFGAAALWLPANAIRCGRLQAREAEIAGSPLRQHRGRTE
jgi:hypothetical protein